MSLPLELIDVILSHIPPRYLLITATVSRDWSRLSLLALYHAIYIHSDYQRISFFRALDNLPLVYCRAIQAIYLNIARQRVSAQSLNDGELRIVASKCPRLDTIAFVKTNESHRSSSFATVWLPPGYWSYFEYSNDIPLSMPSWPSLKRFSMVVYTENSPVGVHGSDRLTMITLTNEQFLSLQRPDVESITPPICFSALECLNLDGNYFTYESRPVPLSPSHMLWLHQHCPSLRHLSIKNMTFDNLGDTSSISFPSHSSVESLTLIDVSVSMRGWGWYHIFGLLCPAIQSLSLDLDMDDKFQYQQERTQVAIVAWITGCDSLASLVLGRLGAYAVSQGVTEDLTKLAQQGEWRCQLKSLDFKSVYKSQTYPADVVVRCSPLISSLETLGIDLSYTGRSSTSPSYSGTCHCAIHPNHPLHSSPAPAFPNLTCLHLRNSATCKYKVLLNDLLIACPRTKTLVLHCVSLQCHPCEDHFSSKSLPTHPLANLTLDGCNVDGAHHLFQTIENQFPRLASLTIAYVNLRGSQPVQPRLNLGHLGLKKLWLIQIKTEGVLCYTLRLYELRGPRMTLYDAYVDGNHDIDRPPKTTRIEVPSPEATSKKPTFTNTLHVVCKYVEDVLFGNTLAYLL
ncbi:hypothetical protein DM01DRAFT_1336501 [Hesseltinella vesiculosa]|uniref:F-box domain-containing protein n=1 Tax=Hesseltinella vesiculosa TaxID=101127 RepID=A0A1X2GFN6_9FUNG|nr:hypothetical protein DM01DRAFT_1336501 [Hesseltinella vesiculosa]